MNGTAKSWHKEFFTGKLDSTLQLLQHFEALCLMHITLICHSGNVSCFACTGEATEQACGNVGSRGMHMFLWRAMGG